MRTLIEGIRLAGLNAGYIALSVAVVVGTMLLAGLYLRGIWFSLALMLALVLFAVAGIAYLYGWLRYTCRFHRPKAFLISLIGVLPNLYLWLGYSTWVKLLPGAEDENCGGIFLFAGVYLIFLLSSIALPVLSAFVGRKAHAA
ncbi:hypothetical protein [Tumebacillus flagellatus]|uniref:Uncharacterized protein n=1 Tax=Tumebacillus flagellatus TaxID=1157490 RepID=A0A074LMS8_9BACL|nr:hypothetical protein [Tumebacillus flagellatus]KEO81133.1 hypothetical protein EL26_22365 [Tumebacillus flagellatus]